MRYRIKVKPDEPDEPEVQLEMRHNSDGGVNLMAGGCFLLTLQRSGIIHRHLNVSEKLGFPLNTNGQIADYDAD